MSFTYALGWTLLHSLWQGLILAVLAIVALRLIPSRYSSARYLVSTTTLGLMLLAGVCTFVSLLRAHAGWVATPGVVQATGVESPGVWLVAEHTSATPSAPILDVLYNFIQSNLQLITVIWVVGVLFFSLRIAAGFWYLSSVRSNAVPMGDVWAGRLKELCARMGLRQEVMLAESESIQAPFVIGYFKPLILIPVGMIGGLSTEQLETILLHELSHVRRADYLVNIIQSFIEALFFFNPFVWVVSAMVRTEREHCCDDTVVRHGHALTYAHALATLETLRLDNTNLAVSLASDKNQLLKRIKRIMEKSVQHYSVKERIVPVVLLVVGLGCASWMTLKPTEVRASDDQPVAVGLTAGDTTKPGKRTTTYLRKQVTEYDEQGKPHTQVIEKYDDGDEAHEMIVSDDVNVDYSFNFNVDEHQFDISMPMTLDIPHFEFTVPMEPMEPIKITMPPMPPVMLWSGDTLVPGTQNFIYESNGFDAEDWASFNAEFQERFKEQFADFYKEHSKEMEAMMKDMAKQYEQHIDHGAIQKHVNEMIEQQAEWARATAEQGKDMAEQQREVQEHVRKQVEEIHAQNSRNMNEPVRVMRTNMRKYQEAIKVELVKDGYLKEDEAIKSIKWENTGDIIINGKQIKDRDKEKYNSIHDKFFKKDTQSVEE